MDFIVKRSFLRKLLLFDGIATGFPSALAVVYHKALMPILGFSSNYLIWKFGALAAYGGLIVVGERINKKLLQKSSGKSNNTPTWLVMFGALSNIVFSIESIFVLLSNKIPAITSLGQSMLASVAAGGLAFPAIFLYLWSKQQRASIQKMTELR